MLTRTRSGHFTSVCLCSKRVLEIVKGPERVLAIVGFFQTNLGKSERILAIANVQNAFWGRILESREFYPWSTLNRRKVILGNMLVARTCFGHSFRLLAAIGV